MAQRLTQEEMERGIARAASDGVKDGLKTEQALPSCFRVTAEVDGVEREWWLSDDVSTMILMRGMDVSRLQGEVEAAVEAGDVEVATAAQRRYDSVVDFIFLGIFGTSYPNEDIELLRRAFSKMDRFRLVMHFFTRVSQPHSSVSIDGESSPTTSPSQRLSPHLSPQTAGSMAGGETDSTGLSSAKKTLKRMGM
jgi:hypothetical protein